MTTAQVETGDMMVVTCRVPCTDRDQLSVAVVEHDVTVSGPEGFRHEVRLPPEADMDRLTAQLYMGILELRAPRIVAPLPQDVPIRMMTGRP